MLFLCMLNTGFAGLLRLGKMTVSDNRQLRDFRKVVLRNSLTWVLHDFEFLLPAHKTDTAFEGNRVHIAKVVAPLTRNPSCQNIFVHAIHYFPCTPSFGFAQMECPQPVVVHSSPPEVLPSPHRGAFIAGRRCKPLICVRCL